MNSVPVIKRLDFLGWLGCDNAQSHQLVQLFLEMLNDGYTVDQMRNDILMYKSTLEEE